MRIIQIPTLFDNYTYLIINQKGEAAIVDSPDAEATLKVIFQERVDPVLILSTHHHMDHVGGNSDLIRFKKMKVYGGYKDQGRIPGLTDPVKEGDTIHFGEIEIKILDIPGHTRGHIAYVIEGAVFCGDTLFAGGCGRLFEGTPAQMVSSLTKLKNLPPKTLVYCGHEYTQKNLEFALTLEPQNKDLKKKLLEVIPKTEKNESTIPTTIQEEKSYNPFLRWDSAELILSLKKINPKLVTDSVNVLAMTRALKDQF